jgi:hypothetical protein
MGMASVMHGRDEMCIKFSVLKTREKKHLEDQGVDGRIMLKWIVKK